MTTAPALSPVVCAACGAAVALTEAPTVVCHHCGATVAVPELHQKALAAAREDLSARRKAAELATEIGALPAWPLRVLGTVFGDWVRFVVGFFFVFMAVGFATVVFLLLLTAVLRTNLFLTLSNATKDNLILPLWFGGMLCLVGLGVYGQRRAVSMRRVQAALSARPAALPGGPATCRTCGGPLSVPDGAIDVRCLYCATDNLVALPASWVGGLQASNVEVHKELDQANAAFVAETRALRRRMALYLGFTATVLGAIYGLAASSNRASRDVRAYSHSEWSDHVGHPRDLIRREPSSSATGWGETTTLSFGPSCAASPRTVRLGPHDCDASGCTLWLFAALRKGEKASLRVDGIQRNGSAVVQAPHWFANQPAGPHTRYGAEEASLELQPGRAATIEASWSTWYQFEVRLPPVSKGDVRLCFEVSPP